MDIRLLAFDDGGQALIPLNDCTDEHTFRNPTSIRKRSASAEIPTAPASAERWMTELHALLRELEAMTAASEALPPVFGESVDDRLVQGSLGGRGQPVRRLAVQECGRRPDMPCGWR